MWEVLRLPAIGNLSFGKITLSFLAVIMSAFFWNIAAAPTTYAADVQWQDGNLKYQNQLYENTNDPIPDVPTGSLTYVYRQPDQGVAHVIFIPQNADMTQEFDATFRSYNFTPPATYTNPQTARTVSVDARGGQRTLATRGVTGEQSGETQCAIQGVGWMVCPVSRFLAWSMDKIFDLLKGFLEVRSVTLDTASPLYRMWDIMRGFANIAFVAAFLIIIYSQVSGIGFSNYNIKKLLPRLIVAALLVNLSYYVCALAVDLSNILGYNLQQAFIDLRGQIVGNNTGANTDVTSWESVTTFILSGGTIGAIAGLTALAGGANILSSVVLLLPFLIGVLIAIVVALLVLAARQALIIILIVVAPLAFVAYLLPNTEKWFDKWKDIFITMMLLFPIFSVIFGGSQLAGSLIIQTATNMSILLLGMFVQVAPIVITPLLIKFSGGLLGRLAGMVNNPSKGMIDRSRNWANEKSDEIKKRNVAEALKRKPHGVQGRLRRYTPTGLRANKALGDRARKHNIATFDAVADKAADRHHQEVLTDNVGHEGLFARRMSKRVRAANAFTYGQEMTTEALKAQDNREKEEAKAGMNGRLYENVNDQVRQATQESALDARAAQSAKYVVNRQLSDAIEKNVALQKKAAGIDVDGGEARAVASAIKARVDDRSENLKNLELMLDVNNLSSGDVLDIAVGKSIVKGIKNNEEIREVAIKKIANGPDVGAIHKLAADIDLSETSNEFWRTAFVDGLKTNSKKPPEFSMGLLDKLSQGMPGGFGKAGMDQAFVDAVKVNAFGAKGIAESDKDTLERLASLLEQSPHMFDDAAKYKLEQAIFGVVKNENFRDSLDKRKDAFERIALSVGAELPYDF